MKLFTTLSLPILLLAFTAKAIPILDASASGDPVLRARADVRCIVSELTHCLSLPSEDGGLVKWISPGVVIGVQCSLG